MTPALFAFGSNGSGQLGIGHDEDVSAPERCIFEDDFSSQKLVSELSTQTINRTVSRIVAGGNHTLVLLNDGRVYVAGWGQPVFKRVFVTDAETGTEHGLFKGVAATWEASVLVVPTASEIQDGRDDVVFVLGSGAKGELGLGAGVTEAHSTGVRIPNFPPRGVEVLSIAGGMGHVVAVCSDGSVYGWGAARKGQLGAGVADEKIVWAPRRIDLEGMGVEFAVSDAVCGREFTVLCGDKEKGEFVVLGPGSGPPEEKDRWGIRTGISASEGVKGYLRIHASWHGVYVHRKGQSICAWGRNDRGQLPPGDLGKAQELAVGSEHCLALLDDDRGRSVVAFGWGEHGNCGANTDAQGNVKGVCARIPLPEGVEVVGVGAGCATSWIIAA
ncbi:regulator of chromosome condensation 1/beta-lactamase-inhibitor protein II [Aspergillus falconensis]